VKPAIDLYFEVAGDMPASVLNTIPSDVQIAPWLEQALLQIDYTSAVEVNIRAVSAEESAQLNLHYRGKNNPTNVLSFPSDIPDFVESQHIGDIAICAEVLLNEANVQGKTNAAHWAHLCVHGLLHLLGYDHINEQDAAEMEAIEIATLSALSIDDPYQVR